MPGDQRRANTEVRLIEQKLEEATRQPWGAEIAKYHVYMRHGRDKKLSDRSVRSYLTAANALMSFAKKSAAHSLSQSDVDTPRASFLARGNNALAVAVVAQQHFKHVDHAALLVVCGLFEHLLEGQGDAQVQSLALDVSESHEVPRKCLCNRFSVQTSSSPSTLVASISRCPTYHFDNFPDAR